MIIGNRQFDTKNHTYIMGILNTTPDSFSDGGTYTSLDSALFHAEEMIRDGADILDTYNSRVARAALEAGADLVNDIWGLQYDPEMGPVIRKYQASCCLMHNRREADYQDFFPDFLEDLRKCIRSAKAAGSSDDRIMLDPGVGFGKTYDMNLAVIRNLDRMQELGYPVLLGTSRKSVIGLTLDLPADQREEGTLATTVYGILHGCSFVRVHDVRANRRAIQMTEAIRKADKF